MPLQATSGAASYDAFGGGVPVVPNYIEDVFSTYLYTGNGSALTITNGIDLSTKGGLVWYKARALAYEHQLVDTVRGAGFNLETPNTSAQASRPTALTAFNTTGFTLGSNAAANGSGDTFVSWTFRKQPKFFDVVTFVKDSSTNQRISHSLDSVPGCIIVKRVTSADDWYVYHRSLGGLNKWISLNSTGAVNTTSGAWGSSAPTDTDFGVSTNLLYDGGGTPLTYVAYVFAHNAGGFGLTGTDNVISCGSYTGNGGNQDISLGYEAQWVMVKPTSVTGNWAMFDNMRGMPTAGVDGSARLRPNLSEAETVLGGGYGVSANATGFTIKGGINDYNASGQTYIYIAIRRGPMKVPTSGTSVLQTLTYTGNGSAGRVYSGVTTVPDLAIATSRSNTSPKNWCDRLRGENPMISTSTDGESGTSQEGKTIIAGSANGTVTFGSYWGDAAVNTNGYTYVNYLLSRAPSFFDEVCYTGTGSARTITHNLAAVPELMIVKCRSTARAWPVYAAPLGNTEEPRLNESSASGSSTSWNSTTPTSSVFSVSNGSIVNASGDTYVAYLFATCAGVSKVGSYTGTATTLQVDCGFTGGARFVLIKRTDSTGDWYVWDSARGIVAGNDPYLLLNTTAAEVTSTDYVDTYSAGFEISSTAPAAINASGGTFVFLAIA